MLAFLHTAQVHVETFGRLAAQCDDTIAIHHEVRADLLAAAVAGGITPAVMSATAEAVQSLSHRGARVIVCTCSTLGAAAEAAQPTVSARVMRVDRRMAEEAIASRRRIVVIAALRSTLEPTTALLRQVSADSHRPVEVVEALCEQAWPLFEAGDRAGYIAAVAAFIEASARPTDVVLLAQASMAPAAEMVAHLGLLVLTSPRLGVRAAIASYRAT